MISLDKLEKSRKAIVESVDLDTDTKRRFSNMGLSRGVILRVCRKTFGSDSLHVKLDCAACIALSKKEASAIKVTPIGNGCGFGLRRGQKESEKCCDLQECEISKKY
jgi:Fe2+ transport system protein FeoA